MTEGRNRQHPQFSSLNWGIIDYPTKVLNFVGASVAFVVLLAAAGIIPLIPELRYKIMEPAVFLDLDQFNKLVDPQLPEKLRNDIANRASGVRVLNLKTPWNSYKNEVSEPMKVFDVETNKGIIVGPNPRGALESSDTENMLRVFGLTQEPAKIASHKATHPSYERVRSDFFDLVRSRVVSRFYEHRIDATQSELSLQELKNQIEGQAGNELLKQRTWNALWVASQFYSLIVVDNVSGLPTSEVRIHFNDARSFGLKPIYIGSPSGCEFHYASDSNTLHFFQLAPKERFVVMVASKTSLKEHDIDVSWTKLSDIDLKTSKFLLLGVLAITAALVLIDMKCKFAKR